MLSFNICIVTLSVLSIIHTSYAQKFTREARIDQRLSPLKLKDKSFFTYWKNNNTIITSFESDYQGCEIPDKLAANRWTLGNGKIVAMTLIVTHFEILDYKNCSSYSLISIDNGRPYEYDRNKEIQFVVPYYDTFDVFDTYRQTCKPCRRNDKGELIQFEHKLLPEAKYFKKYFVEPIKNAFGVDEGYLYSFSFQNYTTVIKILDANYKMIQDRIINGAIVGHSVLHKTAIICHIQKSNGYSECETLNSDLNTMTTFKVKQPSKYPFITDFKVTNLASGGAMVAMKYAYFHLVGDSTYEVFIQQLHADGSVEPAIRVGSYTVSFVDIYSFISNSGEYCLVTMIDNRGEGDHSLLNCVIPKASKYN